MESGRIEKLKKFVEQEGITFADCVTVFAAPDDDPYVEAAQEKSSEGEIEVDGTAVLSGSGDGGNYVMAWMWVSDYEAGIESEDDDED